MKNFPGILRMKVCQVVSSFQLKLPVRALMSAPALIFALLTPVSIKLILCAPESFPLRSCTTSFRSRDRLWRMRVGDALRLSVGRLIYARLRTSLSAKFTALGIVTKVTE
jgi:hypothetical protein